MSVDALFAGPAMRQLRRGAGLTQAAIAQALDVSPAYWSLIENGQRPLSAALLVRLAERFAFDPASLRRADLPGGLAALRRALADPLFADMGQAAQDADSWASDFPLAAAAFLRLYEAAQAPSVPGGRAPDDPAFDAVRLAIEKWRNHFPDLDAQAEQLADELRLAGGDLYGQLGERLRVRHQLAIRILPVDVMPDRLRWLDYHARQLQLSELLRAASRTFHAAVVLGQLEARAEIDALVSGAGLASPTAQALFRRHLAQYFAAAVMMPYGRFLRACEGTGYDMLLLQRRFSAGFEQVAHRLTTMQRVGARGLPFFMLRIDRAGQTSKRYAGASQSPLATSGDWRCPLWQAHDSFARPGEVITDLVELEDDSRWFTQARSVAAPAAVRPGATGRFVVILGLDAKLAVALAAAGSRDLLRAPATPIGLGCRRCLRTVCVQRSVPPAARPLRVTEGERGISPYDFGGD